MTVVKKEIAFFSNSYSDAMSIDQVQIKLSDVDIENIKRASKLVKDNKFITSIKIEVDGEVDYLDENDDPADVDWRVDVQNFMVYDDTFYYYAQNKWDSGDQIESGAFEINEL